MPGLVGLKRCCVVSLLQVYVAEPLMAVCEVALPFGIVWIGLGEALGDITPVFIGGDSALEVFLLPTHVADPSVADRQIVLPPDIGRVVPDQALGDGMPGLVGGARACDVVPLPDDSTHDSWLKPCRCFHINSPHLRERKFPSLFLPS